MSLKQMRQCAKTQEQPDIAIAEILAATEEQEKPIESDPGSDKITIFTIENFELSQIDDSMVGQFFSGDSYVIQYEYEVRGRKQATLFFWLGNDSTTDEKGLQLYKRKTWTTVSSTGALRRSVLSRARSQRRLSVQGLFDHSCWWSCLWL